MLEIKKQTRLLRYTRTIALGMIIFCIACVIEINTHIELVEGSNPPRFNISGNGVDAEFLLYGPYQSCEEEANIATPLYERQPVWQISPPSRRNDKGVSNYSPLVYGAIPQGYEQVWPKTVQTPDLVDDKYYLLWVRVNSASNHAIVFHYKDKRAYKCKT